ncbi:MAG: hypothetical protein WCC65_04940 [Pseudonocardiaceae bacterium]
MVAAREGQDQRIRAVPVRLEEDPRDLVHQAYAHRGVDYRVEQRLGMAEQLADRLARDESASWQVAMSLHLIAFNLSAQIPPRQLIALLDLPVTTLSRRAIAEPEMLRFAALLARTVSMAANKADEYIAAFYTINRAHQLIGFAFQSGARRDRRTMEALQQVYLQESGQLARNAEVGLLELDRGRRLALHSDHGDRPARRLDRGLLRRIRVLARASVITSAAASRIMADLRTDQDRELPVVGSAEDEHLAVANWSVTANIMFMRALLLLATTDFAAGKDGTRRVDMIPYLYWQTVTTRGATFQTSHSMDLTRVALHYSFLADGRTPYRRVKGASLANAVPEYLTDTRLMLDTVRCSQELIGAGHDAGILDNVAFKTVHNVLQRCSSRHYETWLQGHRTDRVTATGDVDAQLRLASAGPELDALDYTSRLVERTRRYAEATPYGLGHR